MDVVIIYNGLGNQMSQYSFYLSKKLRGQDVFYVCFNTDHNGFELKRLFHIKGEKKIFRIVYILLWLRQWNRFSRFLTSFLDFLGIHFYYEDGNYAFQSDAMVPKSGITFLVGGWHNPLYFDDYSELLVSDKK